MKSFGWLVDAGIGTDSYSTCFYVLPPPFDTLTILC